MKKPDQIQDELTGVIYPPPEAIIPQLSAIRSNAISAIKVYESTEDVHSIFPNLDMIQRGIDYMRGAPAIDIPEEPEPPEDILTPGIWVNENVQTTSNRLEDGTYLFTIDAFDIPREPINEELFGTLPIDVLQVQLDLHIKCNERYTITQFNPVLEYYKDDPTVFLEEDGKWYKMKNYMLTEDDLLEYMFLVPTGRNEIEIFVDDESGEIGKFKFITHVHFEKEELPEDKGEDNEENSDNSNG